MIVAFLAGLTIAQRQHECRKRLFASTQEKLSAEDFKIWKDHYEAYEIAERRHRELCAAIKQAGKDASFWP